MTIFMVVFADSVPGPTFGQTKCAHAGTDRTAAPSPRVRKPRAITQFVRRAVGGMVGGVHALQAAKSSNEIYARSHALANIRTHTRTRYVFKRIYLFYQVWRTVFHSATNGILGSV